MASLIPKFSTSSLKPLLTGKIWVKSFDEAIGRFGNAKYITYAWGYYTSINGCSRDEMLVLIPAKYNRVAGSSFTMTLRRADGWESDIMISDNLQSALGENFKWVPVNQCHLVCQYCYED